eukprot:comp12613_c1_seq1/m.7648 comp12613_c1_seq1/g.7648  ORF comp12613_c1_seq1/g.7648 comp12613_c1_seq1/m.7648 type:complete len:327 (-) comp12613_c1_seq1:59-1039(-)
MAGGFARTATAPLELIKTLFQLQSTPIAKGTSQGYQGMWHATVTIAREEGVKALWKGNTVGCLRLGPYSGVKFMVYDTLKSKHYNNSLTTFQQLYVGSFAGIMATLSTYPLDVIKTRMSVQKHGQVYGGTRDALTKIWKHEGCAGMFKGSIATLVGVIPFEGVQFAVYETLKEYCITHRWPKWRWADEKTESDALDILIIGSVAGASGQTVSYPFDLVRKRIQIQAKGLAEPRYSGTIDCFIKIYREEGGIKGWFKGTVPNLLRVVPYGAIIFFTYEFMKSFFAWYEIWRMDGQWHHYLKHNGSEADHIDRSIFLQNVDYHNDKPR